MTVAHLIHLLEAIENQGANIYMVADPSENNKTDDYSHQYGRKFFNAYAPDNVMQETILADGWDDDNETNILLIAETKQNDLL